MALTHPLGYPRSGAEEELARGYPGAKGPGA